MAKRSMTKGVARLLKEIDAEAKGAPRKMFSELVLKADEIDGETFEIMDERDRVL